MHISKSLLAIFISVTTLQWTGVVRVFYFLKLKRLFCCCCCLLHRCWKRSRQRSRWGTIQALSWMRWNTETGWAKTTVHALWQFSRRGSVSQLSAHLAATLVCFPGTSVGAADEGAPAGGEAKEGAGAALQHAAHRIQPHTLWDAHAGYTSSQFPAPQSHGEKLRHHWTVVGLKCLPRVRSRNPALQNASSIICKQFFS